MLRVLVVDDSIEVQKSLARLLGSHAEVEVVGYAEDAAGAIRLIDAIRPDVVVLDVELRDRDRGIDVLRHARRVHPDIKVVALSNFNWHAMRACYLDSGASAYFDKSLEFMDAKNWIVSLVR